MMFPVVVLAAMVGCLLNGNLVLAWDWPWGTPASAPLVDDSSNAHLDRPMRFRAPMPTSSELSSSLLKNTVEMNCRHQMSQALIRDADACKGETNLKQVTRIATVCHYMANKREGSLPAQCDTDVDCSQKMSSEAFGVFTAFHIQAETICRELSSEAWRQAVERMMESLATIAESAIQTLQEAHAQTLEFYAEQRDAAKALRMELDAVADKQTKQAQATAQHFEQTEQHLLSQALHFTRMQTSLDALAQITNKFDELQAFLHNVQSNHSDWSFAKGADRARFYLFALIWLKFISWIMRPVFPRPHARFFRDVQLVCFIAALGIELATPISHEQEYEDALRLGVMAFPPACFALAWIGKVQRAFSAQKRTHHERLLALYLRQPNAVKLRRCFKS